MQSHRSILLWALTPLLGLPASAQSVISAHSGLVHFSDGSVFLDDQRIEPKAGKYDQMNNGSELRTLDGRAEVLLTPGAFLRLGANSAIRMISNDLDDTRVELLSGAAVLEQGLDTLPNTSVTLLYNLDEIHIAKAGRYRVDTEPPQVKVESGEAEVKGAGKSVSAAEGYVVPLDGKLTARKLLNDSHAVSPDDLDRWNQTRENSVAQNTRDAAAASDLSGVIDGWQNNPDAVLQSLGIPPYIPGMSSMIPPPGYGSGYGSGLYGYGSGLYGSGLYGSGYGAGLYGNGLYGSSLYGFGLAPYSLYGLGPVSPLFLYGMPIYRYGSTYPIYTYRGLSTLPSRVGYGGSHSYGTVRSGVGIGRPAIGGARIGGHR